MPEVIANPNPAPGQSEPQNQNPQPSVGEVEINGQKYKVDDVMAWKNGHMMQADYTKKTQEIARERDELKQMRELRDYLNDNPDVARRVADVLADRASTVQPAKPDKAEVKDDDEDDDTQQQPTKGDPRVDALEREVRTFKIKEKLDDLKRKYPDLDEREILQESIKRRSTDFETLYLALKGQKTDDKAYRDTVRQEILAELAQQNDPRTDSLAGSRSTAPANKPTVKLSDDERRIAQIYGMSDEEYAKWKS